MSTRRTTTIIIAIVVLVLLFPFLRSCGVRVAFLSVIFTPVTFYGIVLDQDGKPIPDADVHVSVNNKIGGGGSKLSYQSDKDGKFTVRTHGMSIYVTVLKAGFYCYPNYDKAAGHTGRISGDGFDYGDNFGRGIHKPDKSDPVIFSLYRPTRASETIRIGRKTRRIPRDGTAMNCPLEARNADTGKFITLRCWTRDKDKKADESNFNRKFDWRMEITVPDGGSLQPRFDDYDFTAPESGYASIQTIEMPASLPEREWKSDVTRKYWVKFGDGTYGSVIVDMIAGGDHFALIQGVLNPNVGSRNLEYDPKGR